MCDKVCIEVNEIVENISIEVRDFSVLNIISEDANNSATIGSDGLLFVPESDGGVTNHSQLILDDGTNPHGTTKNDVGLSNVDNTSDVDKPISTATQQALDSKLDKDTTEGVERVYTINPDGSQGTKATSEIGTTQNYFTFSTNTTLSNSHHNAVIWVTATCNITIPSGLRSDFNCTFRTLTGAIATFLTSGTTISAESDGDVQDAKTMSYLAQYTTNNYIISGGGLS